MWVSDEIDVQVNLQTRIRGPNDRPILFLFFFKSNRRNLPNRSLIGGSFGEGGFDGRFSGDGVGGFVWKWWSAGYDRVRWWQRSDYGVRWWR
ncbi:hypothetical protein Hanom_Chr12g01144971 [Helianthus anomalus]